MPGKADKRTQSPIQMIQIAGEHNGGMFGPAVANSYRSRRVRGDENRWEKGARKGPGQRPRAPTGHRERTRHPTLTLERRGRRGYQVKKTLHRPGDEDIDTHQKKTREEMLKITQEKRRRAIRLERDTDRAPAIAALKKPISVEQAHAHALEVHTRSLNGDPQPRTRRQKKKVTINPAITVYTLPSSEELDKRRRRRMTLRSPSAARLPGPGGGGKKRYIKSPKGTRLLRHGPRGGKYYIYNGKKVYLSKKCK